MSLAALAVAATTGTAVVFMGAVMIHDMLAQPLINWLLPICLFLGVALVAGVAAELYKAKVGCDCVGRAGPVLAAMCGPAAVLLSY